jgi:tetratricopeptide (TPR) repeat protein
MNTLQALATSGHDVREDQAYLLMKMGDVAGNLDQAGQFFAQSMALYETVGHRWWCAGLRSHLGYVALAATRYEEARQWFERSLALYQELDDRWQLGWVLDGLSNVALYEQRLAEAEEFARQSLEIHREIGLRDRIADSLATLCWIALANGNIGQARELAGAALRIWREMGVGNRSEQPAGLEEQPLSPLWFGELINQRMAAVAAGLPPEMAARVQQLAGEAGLWQPATSGTSSP